MVLELWLWDLQEGLLEEFSPLPYSPTRVPWYHQLFYQNLFTVICKNLFSVFCIDYWCQYTFQSSSPVASFEDASSSGTIVYRGRHDDPDSPRTPKSRLGIQERSSSASLEDSPTNLAEVSHFRILNPSWFTFMGNLSWLKYAEICGLIFVRLNFELCIGTSIRIIKTENVL